jgi:hypothetical protein
MPEMFFVCTTKLQIGRPERFVFKSTYLTFLLVGADFGGFQVDLQELVKLERECRQHYNFTKIRATRSLFGLHVLCTAVLIGRDPAIPPPPRIWAHI